MSEIGLHVKWPVFLRDINGAWIFSTNLRKISKQHIYNLLTPNVNYSGRTAPLTSKVAFYIFIQQI